MAWTDAQIQAGGGIVSSLINVIGQNYINNRNIEAQRQAQAQAQRNWYEQQEYNSPKNQVARIQEAGLNPDMLYGQSSSGVAGNAPTSAQTINPPTLNPYFLDPMTASNIATALSEQRKNNTEGDLNEKKTLTEEQVKKKAEIEAELATWTQQDAYNAIKAGYQKVVFESQGKKIELDGKALSSFLLYKAAGIPTTYDPASGIINPKWEEVSKSSFMNDSFAESVAGVKAKEFGIPNQQLANLKEDFKQIIALTASHWSLVGLQDAETAQKKYEDMILLFDYYSQAVHHGVKLDWSTDPPSIIVPEDKSSPGSMTMNIVNRILDFGSAVLGVSFGARTSSGKVISSSTSRNTSTVITKKG